MARTRIRDLIANPRVAAALTLGFASGLPYNLSDSTLQAWLATLNMDIKTIGWLTLIGAPYAFKFLWAPILDRYALPFLGRRRGWMLVLQVVLAGLIALLGLQAPSEAIYAVAAIGLLIAFFSATQDIVIDAYRADTLRPEERGVGSTATQVGYRVATWIAGALALIFSDVIGWRNTYLLMAALMGATVLLTWWAPEPERVAQPPRTLVAAVVDPLREFLSRPGAWSLLGLIVLYKFGDAFALKLVTAFLIKGVGFTALEVGAISKTVVIILTLLGTFAGGVLLARLGLYRSLLIFGILQALTNLLYALLAATGKSTLLMVIALGFDNFAGGMGAAAFVAFLMALCDARFSAFQYALLSALASVARNFLGPPAAYLVDAVGWSTFFTVTFFTAIPGLLVLVLLRRQVDRLDAQDPL
ncbi:MAG: MFS transporter [Gammaproteobacteria bacterium]|nr:MFS transporter [Gammaproteobacteria bacterium]